LEATADDFLAILEGRGVMVHAYLRCLHNLALGLNWLPCPVLPDKLWPVHRPKPKRAITAAEHQRIVAAEKNIERQRYYELLWEVGASQSDAAALLAENIQWDARVFSHQRKKTGVWSYIRIGQRLEKLLRLLPDQGALFPNIGCCSCSVRAAEFSRRCHLLGIQGVSLHSYRYAWAERAKTCGYRERFAQEALGHNSKAVHRAYAKKAQVTLPPLEEYEGKILPPLPLTLAQIQPGFYGEWQFKIWQPASVEG
jgi:integrase